MLDEYKELCKLAASSIPDWTKMTKNNLCRAYVANKHDPELRNAYFSAILYKYWSLISKYYYMSSNCATPEDCYEWLVDSVSCCLDLASWENPESSIYKDPNGPDKVINRCMKCARLTYYQFINRKKRKDNFGLLSIEELQEQLGNGAPEPEDPEQEIDLSEIMLRSYVVEQFNKKDYFVSFLLHNIVFSHVFDSSVDQDNRSFVEFNLRKLVKVMNTLDNDFLNVFSSTYKIPKKDVEKAYQYVNAIPQGNMRRKIVQTLDKLKHSDFAKQLLGGSDAN